MHYLFYILTLAIFSHTGPNRIPAKDAVSGKASSVDGKGLFTTHCTSCHDLRNDGTGPPLGGITELLSPKEVRNFIRNPAGVIATGEARATALHKRYKLVMPSFEWMKEADLTAILDYIESQTRLQHIKPFTLDKTPGEAGLTGRLVAPIKPSGLRVELEDIVQLPQLNKTTDLGVVTLRAHPSGDGTLFASDQNGVIYRIEKGKATVFLDVRTHIPDFQSGPGIATGIGSFDFHPDYLHNGLLYISHAETFKGQQADYAVSLADSLKSVVQWVVGEWKVADVQAPVFTGTHRELLRLHAPTFAHGFQDMGFVPGLERTHPEYGLLYFGYGDGGSNNIHHPELGHNLHSFLGTIMRIDPAGKNSRNGRYGIPASNPFVQEKDPKTVKEIYAYGFRNPHRMSWDKANGNRMIATDIGEANIEELNIIKKGGDYGWPSREGNYGINTVTALKTVFNLPPATSYVYEKPFAQYDHEDGNAISGGYVYDGSLAALQHKYIFGDIVKGKLFYVNIDPTLSDSTVYELAITQEGKATNLQEMSHTKRLHLRVAYDPYNKQVYIISKFDGKIRRVVNAY